MPIQEPLILDNPEIVEEVWTQFWSLIVSRVNYTGIGLPVWALWEGVASPACVWIIFEWLFYV